MSDLKLSSDHFQLRMIDFVSFLVDRVTGAHRPLRNHAPPAGNPRIVSRRNFVESGYVVSGLLIYFLLLLFARH